MKLLRAVLLADKTTQSIVGGGELGANVSDAPSFCGFYCHSSPESNSYFVYYFSSYCEIISFKNLSLLLSIKTLSNQEIKSCRKYLGSHTVTTERNLFDHFYFIRIFAKMCTL